MAFPIKTCVVCNEEFELKPDKPGYANRCPTCTEEGTAPGSSDKTKMTAEERRSIAEAKRNVVAAIAKVAAELGNTPSVCRKCYVHPAVLEAYLGGITIADAKEKLDHEIAEHAAALRREELALLKLLEQRALLEKASSKQKKTQ